MLRGIGLAVAVATVAIAPIVVIAPSAHAISAPTNLAPSGAVESNTPTLSWSRPSGTVQFEVQVDNDPSFGSPEIRVATTNTRYVPKVLLGTGPQNWRVMAVSAAGTESGWTTETFMINPIAPPTPISPVDGTMLSQPDDPPLLTWEGTQGAVSYTVEVDTEDDFLGPTYKTYTTKTTSLVVPDPLAAPTYFWRVTAVKAAGVVSLPSNAVSFQVEPLQPVVLRSPEDNPSTTVEDVVLDWDPVPGAQYYQLRVATDSDFNTRVDDEIKVPKIYGTRYSPKVTYNNNQYYWQVRAVDLAGKPTGWTTVNNSFNRVWPDRPQPVHPVGDGVQVMDGAPYFQWTPVQHASHYQLDVGTDANFSPGSYASCLTTVTTYTPGNGAGSPRADEKCLMNQGATMYWRVRGRDLPHTNGGVQGIYSPVQAFRYQQDYFTNVTPVDGATVDVPTFAWQEVKGAEKYQIEVFTNAGSRVVTATTYSTSYTPVGSRLDPTKSPFTWKLTATEANGTKSVIETRSFSVSGTIPTTGDAPLTPHSGRSADPATVRAPNLSWEPHPDADHYRIFMGDADSGFWWTSVTGDVLSKSLPYPAVTDTSTRTFSPGSYDWYVVAYTASNTVIATGPVSSFRVADFLQMTGQEIAVDGMTLDGGSACDARLDANGVTGPRCDKVPTTPVFSWNPQPGAAFYVLYISEDASFTNLLEQPQYTTTTNTRYAFTKANVHSALPESQAGQAYYWHVRPCRATGRCAPDPVSSNGMATNAFRKESPKVVTAAVPTESVDGQPVVTSSEVTLDWNDYFDTNRAATWATTGELGNQSAMQYHVQVSTTDTFSTRIDDVYVDQSTYTAYDRLYPDGTLYWRVQAIDGDGNGLAWSVVRSFVKSSPSAVPSYPLNGAHVSGTTPFRWEAQPFNASYRIEVYRNDDVTFSATNRLFYKDVKTTAYAWNETVPASSVAYVWRVRRTDGYGNLGAWSATGRFFSDGAVPTLLGPTDKTYQSANGPLFTWTDAPGASSYLLEYKRGTSTTTITTAATAWATDRSLADGIYTWRVTAKDPSRNTLGISGWRTFYVDGTRPTVTSYTPMSSARRTTNFTARFSESVRGVSGSTVRLYLGRTKVRAGVSYSSSLRRATLNPRGYLKRGKTYTMKVSGAIKDANGNPVVAKTWKVRIR